MTAKETCLKMFADICQANDSLAPTEAEACYRILANELNDAALRTRDLVRVFQLSDQARRN